MEVFTFVRIFTFDGLTDMPFKQLKPHVVILTPWFDVGGHILSHCLSADQRTTSSVQQTISFVCDPSV